MPLPRETSDCETVTRDGPAGPAPMVDDPPEVADPPVTVLDSTNT